MVLANTVWSQWRGWEDKCQQDSMTDEKNCTLTTFYQNIGIMLMVTGTGVVVMGIFVTDDVLSDNSTHQFRIDKYKSRDSQSSDASVATFYNSKPGKENWNRLIKELKSGENIRVRVYLWPDGHIEKTFTLFGFDEAFEQLRQHTKQFIGTDINNVK